MNTVNQLELLYQKVVKGKSSIDDADFLGLNIDPKKAKFEFKLYSPAKPPSLMDFQSPLFNSQQLALEMIRCRCDVECSSGSRTYYSLKNRTDQNIMLLIQSVSKKFPQVEKNVEEIVQISKMNVTSVPSSMYASLHMIGCKEQNRTGDAIGVEWMLRTMPDPNDPGYCYSYNDDYFYEYISNLHIIQFSKILNIISPFIFSDKQKEETLHLWLAAIDYFPNGNKKYKIYIKGEKPLDLCYVNSFFCDVTFNIQNYVEIIQAFARVHPKLQLYGFAICLDTDLQYSFNYYFFENSILDEAPENQ